MTIVKAMRPWLLTAIVMPLRNDCLGPSGLGSAGRPAWSGANALKTVFPTLAPTTYIRIGTGLAPAISASGLGSPHLHRDWAQPCHICAGTWRMWEACAVADHRRPRQRARTQLAAP